MKSILFICLSFVFAVAFDEFSISDEENSSPVVVDLTRENFSDFLDRNSVVLVEFYAPWCGHCKELAPHYEEAARLLKDSIAFAKVDATIEESLAQEYSIEGYPTLKIFHKNSQKPIDYDGPRQPAEEIVEYLRPFADPSWTSPPSDVEILTTDNFTRFIFNEELTLVEFYAPWCGYCKRLEPKFEKAATILKKETTIRLAKVDATVETMLAETHNLTGYPSLFIYRKGGKSVKYEGEMTENGIISTMKEFLALPSRQIRNLNDYKSLFRRNDQPVLIGVFNDENERFYHLFIDFAYRNRKNYQFGHTFQPISSLNDVKSPSIVLQHHPDVRSKYEKEKFVFDQENALEKDLEEFVMKNQIPLVGIITQENQKNVYLNIRPICIVIYDLDFSFDHRERTQYWRNKILKVASKYVDKFRFAVADETKNSLLLKEFGLEESAEDLNVGCYDKTGLKYRMEDEDEFTSESFEEFVKRLDKGKIKAFSKSQSMPKVPVINGIRILVGKNFDQIVKDPTKNVLVFFYAPWCGHCTKFKPIYSDLAKKFAGRNDLIIGQIDASANDIPSGFDVPAFPTIYFVDKTNRSIKYDGNRELDDLINFVEKNLNDKTEL